MRIAIENKTALEIVPMPAGVFSFSDGSFYLEESNSQFKKEFNVSDSDSNLSINNLLKNHIIHYGSLILELEDYFRESLFCEAKERFAKKKWDSTNQCCYEIDAKLIASKNSDNSILAVYFKRKKRKQVINYSAIFPKYADGIFWVADANTFQFLYINEQVHTILGYSVEEWMSSPTFWQDHIHPDDREEAIQFCATETKENRNHRFEYRMIDAQNKIVWIKDIVNLMSKEDGGLHLVGVMIDVTDKKRIEEEIKAKNIELEYSTKKISQILEQSLDIICTFDVAGQILTINNAAYTTLGYLPNEMIGRNYREFISSEFIVPVEKVNQEMKLRNSLHNFEADYVSKSGDIVHLIWSVNKEPIENIFFGVAKDITERKKSETELKRLYHELEKNIEKLANSNSELEQFAYVASHDLQEPLRMITGFLNLIEKKYEDQLDNDIKSYIHYAVDGATRMKQIILDLLEFSKIGSEETPTENVDLNNVVNNVLILHKKQISEINANVIYSDLPILNCHGVLIRQIFQNLLSNALKYHSENEKPTIQINYHSNEEEVTFIIKDNGIGIPDSQRDKIFNIFHRLHSKEKYSGTGMGLAMTKKIIENLKGKIWVTANSPQGSIFTFTLPISTLLNTSDDAS